MLPTTTDYEGLLRRGATFIDVRAPVEFAKGAVPGAINLPILDNTQRAKVGTCYKRKGQEAAIALGMSLVSGEIKTTRVTSWTRALEASPDIALYCWRGGLRSKTAQRWIADAGKDVLRVEGGFKALRTACMNVIARAAREMDMVVVSGRTGSGKTRLLHAVAARTVPRLSVLDLEGRANHRGSAFGKMETPQPSTVDFENALAVDILKLPRTGVLAVEDESRCIGRSIIPEQFFDAMCAAPIMVLECPMDERVKVIFEEYVQQPLQRGTASEVLSERLQGDLAKIKKRLGGQRYREVDEEIREAFDTPSPNALARHAAWIEHLLVWYYDPQYDYQLSRKQDRVVARGAASVLLAALEDRALRDHADK